MINKFSEALSQKVIAQRWPVFILCLGLSLGIGISGSNALIINNNGITTMFFDNAEAVKVLSTVFLGLLVFLFILLRSIVGTMAVLIVAAASSILSLGIFGWIGIELTPASSIAPALIMSLAVADAVHLIATMRYHTNKKLSRRDAIERSVKISFYPIIITSLTTALGFFGFILNKNTDMQNIGIIAIVGIFIALIFSVTFLPAIMTIWPARIRRDSENSLNLNISEKLCHYVLEKKIISNVAQIGFILFCLYSYLIFPHLNSLGLHVALFVIIISTIISLFFKQALYGVLCMLYGGGCIIAAHFIFDVTNLNAIMLPVIASIMAFGITVDNKIHLFMKANYALKNKGMQATEAVKYAYQTVGSELVSISILLLLSFASFYKSSLLFKTQLASFMLIVITLTLVIDFLIIPKTLEALLKKKKQHTEKD